MTSVDKCLSVSESGNLVEPALACLDTGLMVIPLIMLI